MEAYRTLDIDTFFMTAGSIVLSDNGLVNFFETPNATSVCILDFPPGPFQLTTV